MNPVAAIIHLAAIVLGAWGGLAIMGAISLPETGTEARERVESAGTESVQRVIEEVEEAREQERAGRCLAGASAVSDELPQAVLRTMLRRCRGAPALPPRSVCIRVVADVVDPAGPAWTRANAACRAMPGG